MIYLNRLVKNKNKKINWHLDNREHNKIKNANKLALLQVMPRQPSGVKK